MAQRNGTGMFPREIMNRFPLLPLEEEGRLNDMPLRENFTSGLASILPAPYRPDSPGRTGSHPSLYGAAGTGR